MACQGKISKVDGARVVTTVEGVVLSLLAAFVPSAVYVAVIWWLDRYEREPWRLLLVAFAWGALPAVLLSVVLEYVLGNPFASVQPLLLQDLAGTSLIAPIIEELAKALALLVLFLVARREFDGVLDGVVYGAVIGFGFAMTENTLYFIEVLGIDRWMEWRAVVTLRSLLFGFNHAFYTALIGAGFGLVAQTRRQLGHWSWLFPVVGLMLAISFHAVHNMGLVLANSSMAAFVIVVLMDWSGVLLLVAISMLALYQERQWIVSELSSEIGHTLTLAEFMAAASFGRRFSLWLEVWRTGGWTAYRRASRQHRLVTELAFLKRRVRQQGEAPHLARRMAAVRQELLLARTNSESAGMSLSH
jgi:RsiW-degrading membrane proteinase PrsW (M82 family)